MNPTYYVKCLDGNFYPADPQPELPRYPRLVEFWDAVIHPPSPEPVDSAVAYWAAVDDAVDSALEAASDVSQARYGFLDWDSRVERNDVVLIHPYDFYELVQNMSPAAYIRMVLPYDDKRGEMGVFTVDGVKYLRTTRVPAKTKNIL